MAYCETCGRDEVACQTANDRVPRPLRHHFVARRDRRTLVADVSRRVPTCPAPAGWRSSARPAHPTLDLGNDSIEDGS